MMEILPRETRHAELGEEGLRIALSRRRDKTDARLPWVTGTAVADTFGRAEPHIWRSTANTGCGIVQPGFAEQCGTDIDPRSRRSDCVRRRAFPSKSSRFRDR